MITVRVYELRHLSFIQVTNHLRADYHSLFSLMNLNKCSTDSVVIAYLTLSIITVNDYFAPEKYIPFSMPFPMFP